MSFLLFLTIFLSIFSNVQAARFGCLNGSGKTVDWWVIYKESKGYRYVYLDSTMEKPLGLHQSKRLDNAKSPLSRTVLSSNYFPFHTESSANLDNEPFYISWNDQPKKGSRSSVEAHAKGFMGIRNTSQNVVESFFIQHSLPRFPQGPDYIYDTNLYHRAQHFFCISMKDEFVGQDTKTSLINPNALKNSNFFEILWNYAAVIKVKSFQPSNARYSALFKNVFKALTNDLKDGAKMLTSFLIKSAGIGNAPIEIHVTAKSPDNHIDIFDDVTSLLSIHHEDYRNIQGTPKTGHPSNGKTAMLMITQSHTDPATLGINQKVLIDSEDHFATVHILNSAYINLPVRGSVEPHHQPSMYCDHSKWSVNVIYGTEGSFPATLCFYDLNRSNKQTHRGGGAFCLNSSFTGSSPGSAAIWNMFMSFGPKPTDMARFKNSPVDEILNQLFPSNNQASSPLPFNTATPKRSRTKQPHNNIINKTPIAFNLGSSSSSSTAEDYESMETEFVADDDDDDDDDLLFKLEEDEDSDISSDYKANTIAINELEFKAAYKNEAENLILSNNEMSYLKFSKEEVEESGQHKILILHQHASKVYPWIFDIVPCPFRYDKNGRTAALVNDKVPSLVGLTISNYYSQYGPRKLNELLNESFKLSISSTKFSGSPAGNFGNCVGYRSNIKVPRSASKRNYMEFQDTFVDTSEMSAEKRIRDDTFVIRSSIQFGGSQTVASDIEQVQQYWNSESKETHLAADSDESVDRYRGLYSNSVMSASDDEGTEPNSGHLNDTFAPNSVSFANTVDHTSEHLVSSIAKGTPLKKHRKHKKTNFKF